MFGGESAVLPQLVFVFFMCIYLDAGSTTINRTYSTASVDVCLM